MKKLKLPLFIFLVLFLAFFSFNSLIKPGYFPMHDDMQPIRVLGLDQCLRDGQIPCRWVPDLGYGYGYPLFIYYPPLAYYLMEVFHLVGFFFLDSINIDFILTFIFSGLAMFLLSRSLWGDFGGLVAAVFYVYAPYRATDVYSRGAVGEFTALVFLPLIFWAILEFVRQKKTKYLIFLALSYGGLLLTHNITSLIFTPVVVLWGLFLLWYYQAWKLLPKLLGGAILGVGLAGFFILPVVFEKNLVHVESMLSGYFNYLAHFVSLRQLFFSTHWGYGSSVFGPDDDFSFAIGTFPWRFLALVIFAFSIMAGAVVSYFKKYFRLVGILLISGVIILNVNYFRPIGWLDITDQDKFSGELWEKQITASIFDYLPVFAKAPPAGKAPAPPEGIF